MASLDHIGIAVQPGTPLRKLLSLLDLPVTGEEDVAGEKVHVEWVPLQAAGNIELLTPLANDPAANQGAIAKYLEKTKKDGIHHLCFRVENIQATSASLQKEGFRLIYDAPKEGAHHCLVNFVHPKSTGGILIEISQTK